MEEYVVVIGGLNMDIAGLPGTNYVIKDSNPGKIQMSPGGVGRNISHNLVNLDIPTYLISMYGDDELGESLERSCEELNIRLDY
ncbi:carbohydrate kinase, partial [Salmonella enterica subsp. enterica serovar Typhimurium]